VAAPLRRNSCADNETVKESKTPEGWKQKPAKNRQKRALDEEKRVLVFL
jgi:hypothetical protein